MIVMQRLDLTEPTEAQKEAGNYRKRKVEWRGLTISIENEPGTFRRGRSRTGHEWEVLMRFAYGYVNGSMGVDGDQVDVYLGPNLDAPIVYVIHQRRYGDWEAYDEDKCMIGFDSEADAIAAFASNYNDPRFLGPVTPLLAEEFVQKVRATKEQPAMIKGIVVRKSYVGPYIRGGRMISGYQNGKTPAERVHEAQRSLFGDLPEMKKPAPRAAVIEKPKAAADVGEKMIWGRAAPDPKALILHDRADGGTILAHRDASGKVYGVRDVGKGEDHDIVVSAWKNHARARGLEIEDARKPPEGHTTKHYVTMRRAKRTAYLAGPFDSEEEAAKHVEHARKEAEKVDQMTHFDGFGVSARTAAAHPKGVLHDKIIAARQGEDSTDKHEHGKEAPQKETPKMPNRDDPKPVTEGVPYHRTPEAMEMAARRKQAGKGSGKRWGANKNKDDWKKIGDAVYGERK